MTTAREICELALKEAGVLGVGQTALAEDINDTFTLLRRMTAKWQKDRWLVPALTEVTMPGNDAKSNTIGTGGYYNVPRPLDISAGYAIQLNTGSTPVSLPLRKIFSFEDYSLIAVKDLNTVPSYFFYDNAFTQVDGELLGNVYIWPIPSATYAIHLVLPAQLGFPTDLDSIFYLPPEYEEALHYNLCIRICSMYNLTTSPEQQMLAKTSLNTIKRANTQVPTLLMPPALRRNYGFNIYNADGY